MPGTSDEERSVSPSTASSELATARPRSRLKVAAPRIAALKAGPRRRVNEHDLYEARFRALARIAADGVWMTDAQGKIVEEIPQWAAFTGQSLKQMRGDGWSAAVHPDDRQRVFETWLQAVRGRATHYESEYRLRRRDGVYRKVCMHGVPVLAADGTVCEWLGIWSDITERKQQEDELRKYRQGVEQLDGARIAKPTAVTDQLAATIEELEAFAY